MAYFGIFDGMEINGQEVDTSKLESEGKIIVGDEEWDASDMITDEDRLEIFNEGILRTKEELLSDIDQRLGKIGQDSGKGVKHSPAYYERYKALIEKFRAAVEKRTFFDKLEDWWEYRYDINSTGITLVLVHTNSFDLYPDDSITATEDTAFELLHVPAKLLTVEQYAKAYGVTTTTVRQWIRRGKLRTAMKQGNEWRIPELAEIMDRGYRSGHYWRMEYLTDLPEEYAFFNEYDYVDINQNREHKDMYDLCFSKDFSIADYPNKSDWDQFYKEMQMGQKEREKFELYLIASPFVEAHCD